MPQSIMKHQRGMLAGENLLWSKFSFLSFLMSKVPARIRRASKGGSTVVWLQAALERPEKECGPSCWTNWPRAEGPQFKQGWQAKWVTSYLFSPQVLATYFYKDIDALAEVSDYPGGFVVIKANFGRMHLFARFVSYFYNEMKIYFPARDGMRL